MVKRRNTIFIILSILLASLVFMGSKGGCNKEVEFSHSVHLDIDPKCDICHGSDLSPAKATHDNCISCHELDMEAPDERCLKCHLKPESQQPVPTSKPQTYWEVKFKHEKHQNEDGGTLCSTCHGKLKRKATSFNFPSMDQCTACHLKTGASLKCSTCHEKIRLDKRPTSHSTAWMTSHGQVLLQPDASCNKCHKEESCASCHMDRSPKNHTQFWRDREHGLKARYSREKCTVCHQEDFCISCHETTPPQSHKPGWGEPTLKHCQGCHLPLERTECFTCHKQLPPAIFHSP